MIKRVNYYNNSVFLLGAIHSIGSMPPGKPERKRGVNMVYSKVPLIIFVGLTSPFVLPPWVVF